MSRSKRTFTAVAAAVLIAGLAGPPATGQVLRGSSPGNNNAITDVPGIRVGHFTDPEFPTGTTVVYSPQGAVGGVDVRGGGPGTRETDLLDPRNLVQKVNAITLSGGSAYGLAAASGTMRWLEEHQKGYLVGATPDAVVPIVPSAIIFDLNRGGEFGARPTEEFGYKAAAATATGPVAQGSIGAGAGAVSGGIKGGVGTASVELGRGVVVGAIAVVNSVGATWDPRTCELYALEVELGDEFGDTRAPDPGQCTGGSQAIPNTLNTTIGIVATNVGLDKPEAQKMAGVAQDGLARAIRPAHTLLDGDTIFGMSTGKVQATSICKGHAPASGLGDLGCTLALNDIFAAAADTFERAVGHAILNAQPNAASDQTYCAKFPSACGGQAATRHEGGAVKATTLGTFSYRPVSGGSPTEPGDSPWPLAAAVLAVSVAAYGLGSSRRKRSA